MSFLFFLLGFVSLLSQVILLREMAVVFQGHEITLGVSLAAWLLWGGLGSASAKIQPHPSRSLARILSGLGLVIPASDILIRLSKILISQGDIPRFASSLIWPFFFLAAPCWLLGRAFRAGVAIQKGKGGWLYFMESLGAVVGGALSIFLLVGRVPSLVILSAAGLILSLAGWWLWRPLDRRSSDRRPSDRRPSDRRSPFHPVPALAFLLNVLFCGFSPRIDLETRRLQWSGTDVLAQKETRYDHLLLVRLKNSVTLFQNGVATSQIPDPSGEEELVHWPLLAHANPKRVLCIGLSTVFSMGDIRKHAVDSVDVVEPDGQAIDFLTTFPGFDPLLRESLPKTVVCEDPRRWLKTHPRDYDVIIQSLPDPTNAALNRFFTVEFFRDAREALADGGILAFSVSSSEHDLPAGLAIENRSILNAAHVPFAHLEVIPGSEIPGSKMIVLASDREINLDPALLSARMASRKIQTRVLLPETLPSYLDRARRDSLWTRVRPAGGGDVNSDVKPIAYAVAWRVWFSKRFSPWFFMGPVLILLIIAGALRKMWAQHLRRRLFAEQNLLFLVGFGGMVMEMAGLLLFQSLSGALYWQLGLLSSSFMLGLVAGSGATARVKMKAPLRGLWAIVFLMGLFALVLGSSVEQLYSLPHVSLTSVFVLFLFIPGFLVGAAFPFAVAGLSAEAVAGLYAADLWGSAFGAFVASAFFIPLLGYSQLLLFTGFLLLATGLIPPVAAALQKHRS